MRYRAQAGLGDSTVRVGRRLFLI
ncbi:hypothetical protein SBBP2_1620003 [Burkholderiales bacterium]|nr:hypothetical protein SBBP2_1620003 [Burkholderiales bacterium]